MRSNKMDKNSKTAKAILSLHAALEMADYMDWYQRWVLMDDVWRGPHGRTA